MNHDEFSDQIRRKLESVEPQFQEKDWTRMHQALGHATPVIAIGTRTGLMAAASVAAVAVFGGVAYQQYQANQQLRQQVQTLTQTVQTLRQAGTPETPQLAAAPLPPDTVYLTRDVVRYVPMPYDRKRFDGTTSGVDPAPNERMATTQSANATPESTHSLSDPNAAEKTTTLTTTDRTSAGNEATRTNRAGLAANGTPTLARTGNNRVIPPKGSPTDRYAASGSDRSTETAQTRPLGDTQTPARPDRVASEVQRNNLPQTAVAANAEETAMPSRTLLILPIGTQPFRYDSAYYQEGVAHTTRRVRRMLNALVPDGVALAKVEVNRSEPNWLLRFGPGVSLGGKHWSAGVYGEFRLTNRWRVGLGLTKVNLEGESFLTELDFARRRPDEFRKNFAPKLDPRYAVINITSAAYSWLVPLSVSYRAGLGNGWSLVPSVGLNLSIGNREKVDYSVFRSGILSGDTVIPKAYLVKRPKQDFHTGSMALLLEKNWGDWGLQLGPYVTAPLNKDPSPMNISTAGASARLFYQVDWKKRR